MLLVIFGAGASYDSAASYHPNAFPDHPKRPPLADELFDDRDTDIFKDFSECLGLITNLRKRPPSTTVEQVLETYAGQVHSYPARLRHLMAIRYALQMILFRSVSDWKGVHGGITNYAALLDHIEACRSKFKKVLLVTFNYDTMIEEALKGVHINIQSVDDYCRSDRYKLVKAHGSVNWARLIIDPPELTAANAEGLISEAGRFKEYGDWHICGQPPATHVTLPGGQRSAAVPAIALPLLQKAEFECPDDHLQSLEEFLPHVNKVLIIGWRAAEPHFTSLLRQHLRAPSWHIVAGAKRGAGDIVVDNLRRAGLGGTFTDGQTGIHRSSDES